jgi:hypothetical protein
MPSPNIKNPTYYGFGSAHYLKHPAANAVFYVQDAARGGSDTNDGLTPDSPFLTITYALTQAALLPVANQRQVYIFVQRTTLASETWPIEISQAYLHLIGTPDQASPTPAIRPQDDNHGLVLAAGGIEVAGFLFSCPVANTDACIYSAAAQQWMNHIHHNYFAWDSEAYDCIRLDNQQQQVSIHHNYFGAHGFSNYAINATTPAGRTLIEDNVILVKGREMDGAGGIIMHPVSGGGVIRNNAFTCPDSAHGEAINLTGGQDQMVDGNHAMSGTGATMTNEPYRDIGASHWGVNWTQNAVDLPRLT